MYCESCGQKNNKYAIYCSNDGTLLHQTKVNIKLSKDNIQYCNSCGNKLLRPDLYCNNCGVSLYKPNKSITKNIADIVPKYKAATYFDAKSPIIRGFIGFGILFILSLLLSSVVNLAAQYGLYSTIGYNVNVKIVSVFDLLFLTNFINLKLAISAGTFASSVAKIAGSLSILILIPFITFFVIGILQAKKDNKKNRQFDLKSSLVTALTYCLTLTVLSLIYRAKVEVPIPYASQMVVATKSFSIIAAFFKSGLISFISLLSGYGTYSRLVNKEELLGGYSDIFTGLNIFLVTFLSVFIITGIFLKVGVGLSADSLIILFIAIFQAVFYALSIINFGRLTVNYDMENYKLSLLREIRYINDHYGLSTILIYLVALVPIAIFFVYGKKSKKKSKLYIAPVTYSLTITAFAYITNIKASLSGSALFFTNLVNEQVKVGVSLIPLLITSLLISIGATYIGNLMSERGVSDE